MFNNHIFLLTNAYPTHHTVISRKLSLPENWPTRAGSSGKKNVFEMMDYSQKGPLLFHNPGCTNAKCLIHAGLNAICRYVHSRSEVYCILSYDVASGSEITPCNKICKPLVVYRFTGNVMTFITTLRT